MTFPESKFPSIGAFADAYFGEAQKAFASVDRAKLEAACRLLEEAYRRGNTVYACGNGGSAAISNHLMCDHLKGVRTDTRLEARVISLSANVETITAIANDIDYADVFVYQLSALGKLGDVLITVSSSGDSENVVRAAEWAMGNGLSVIAMTGFSGGRSAKLSTVNLHVKGDNYGVIEDTHQALMHILAQYIRLHHMDEKLVKDRKF